MGLKLLPAIAFLALSACGTRNPPPGIKPVLWTDPGDVSAFDFTWGKNGPAFAPKPPFTFVAEDLRGNNPKVFVDDAAGRRWRVKGGPEARAETFCTRLASALGYYGEPTYFIPEGVIEKIEPLKRAADFIASTGQFAYASFERFEPGLTFVDNATWRWDSNPFTGTPQLAGLKILVMFVSDWDNKDARDSLQGSNLGVLERVNATPPEWIYFVDDWGQSMGAWGHQYRDTSVFDCGKYRAQSAQFITGLDDHSIRFGFEGQHSRDFMSGITVADAAWLLRRLGRITDAQWTAALHAAGALPTEVPCFVAALTERTAALRAAVSR